MSSPLTSLGYLGQTVHTLMGRVENDVRQVGGKYL